MKNKNITKLGSLLLILLCLNSYGASGIDPGKGGLPPFTEVVMMNIGFQTMRCQVNRDMKMCSVSAPKIPSSATKNIELVPINSLCNGSSGNTGTTPCYSFQGHWIDLEQTYYYPGKRYIGIVTIIKSTSSQESNKGENLDWYHIQVEVLGKGKTLAKMETGVRSINQLQSVNLLAEEVEEESGTITTSLNVGPNLFPEVKESNLTQEHQKLEPAKWKVITGRILQ